MLRPASRRPRDHLACTAEGALTLRHALAGLDAEIRCAFSREEALASVESVDVVVCSLRFDESRMLDFMAHLAREHPHLPLVCCHVIESDLPEPSLDAAFTVADHLGAVAVVNLTELARRLGTERAEASLRAAIVPHLHDVGHASMS
jgi:CheY-like chemotaxis protein